MRVNLIRYGSMSRIVRALLIYFGVLACAHAQDAESIGASASGASAALAASEAPSISLAASVPAVSETVASETAAAQDRRISSLLVAKFGVARAKAEEITDAVIASASKYSLPPALVLAVISIESRFREKAHGKHGATGLMQVVPAAHRNLVRHIDLTKVTANIEAGSHILHGYIQSAQGDVAAALKSYGGSSAYARMVSSRERVFEPTVAASEATPAQAAAVDGAEAAKRR
jgi:soluble lytic murein transglycosylase-like protein